MTLYCDVVDVIAICCNSFNQLIKQVLSIYHHQPSSSSSSCVYFTLLKFSNKFRKVTSIHIFVTFCNVIKCLILFICQERLFFQNPFVMNC